MAAVVSAQCALRSCVAAAPPAFGSSTASSTSSLACPLPLRILPRRKSTAPALRTQRRAYKGPSALFDRGTGGSDDSKKADKKFITKEEEPEQFWQTADEREGKNPMSTPLPYILILSVLSPFLILAVAFANNWIKIPVR